jgi:hypothetical protein
VGTSSPGSLLDATSASAQLHAGPSASHGFIVSCTDTSFDRSAIVDNSGFAAGINLYVNNNGEYAGLHVGTTGVHSLRSTRSGSPFDINTAGSLSFTTAGSERMRLDSSGRLGLGTSVPVDILTVAGSIGVGGSDSTGIKFYDASPAAANLRWLLSNNNNNSDAFTLYNYDSSGGFNGTPLVINGNGNTSFDSGTLFVDAVNNRVGIGTTSPAELLHISSTTADAVAQVQTTFASGSARLNLYANSGGVSQIRFGDEGSVNVGLLTYEHTTDAMAFRTNGNERARIDSSGRLLVGTTSAVGNGKLRVQGNTSTDPGIIEIALNASRPTVADVELAGVIFTSGTNSNAYASVVAFSDGASSSSADIPGRLVFSTTADGASSPTERMRIDNAGTTTLTSAAATAPFIAKVSTTEAARIDSSGRLLVGTSSSTASGDGVLQVSKSQVLSESATDVANNGTAALTFTTGGGAYHGFLSISVCSSANATVSTSATYSIFGRGTSSTITQIATANGAGGACSFTVTTPSGGIATVTNTAGSDSDIYISFFGGLGG